jgi:selenocysteine lyase/cysteine desulfurase
MGLRLPRVLGLQILRAARRHLVGAPAALYARELVNRLGADAPDGLLRLGLVHYNTADEVDALLDCLDRLP